MQSSRSISEPKSVSFAGRVATAAFVASLAAVALPASGTAQQDAVSQAAPVVVDSVVVQGNERESDGSIALTAGLQAGQTVDYRDIQDAIRRLWATGSFEDVRVYAREPEAGQNAPVVLVIDVAEQPLIADVRFVGLEHVSERTVRDSVGLRAGDPLQPDRVAAAKALIRDKLGDDGFWVKSLEHRVEPVAGRPGEFRLIFDVEEGRRVAITDVVFEGNEVFSDDRLHDVMSTKEEGFLWFRPGTYDEETLQSDLRSKLPQFYSSHGFIDLAVQRDTMIVDEATGKARLVISVDEGPRYALDEFEIEGNRHFSSERLERYFQPERGTLLSSIGLTGGPQRVGENVVFDAAAFEAATQQVRQLYNNSGYLYAQVNPVVERVEVDGQPAVRAVWRIQEGDPAYINRVTILGNTYTHEEVIRDRILLLPGDIYSEDRLVRSYRSISSLGFFKTPMKPPQIEPTDEGDVNITFEVEEKQTGSINFGTAIGGRAVGIAGFLGYDQPNLFGKAKSGHLRWEFGRYTNNFEARYSDPAILDTRLSGSFSLFSSRDRFSPFVGQGERRRTGIGFRAGYPFPLDPRFTRFYAGYSISETSYESESSGTSIFDLPDATKSSIEAGLVRNTLDHPIFPTVGTRQELSLEFNGGPLGGEGDYQKYELAGSWYVPIGELGGDQPGGRPVRFTLGVNADAGALFGDAGRFPLERFFLGGVQFGESLRGYDEATIAPRGFVGGGGRADVADRFGNAFLRVSAEYAARFGDNLSVAVFYDAGNVWSDPAQIDPSRLFRGAGVGLTLVTPFGPLGLDYAYGFDKDVPGWQLHFKFGPQF